MTKQPIIWKREKETINGGCAHWWSMPFTTAMGLTCECFKCKELKFIKVEKDEEVSAQSA